MMGESKANDKIIVGAAISECHWCWTEIPAGKNTCPKCKLEFVEFEVGLGHQQQATAQMSAQLTLEEQISSYELKMGRLQAELEAAKKSWQDSLSRIAQYEQTHTTLRDELLRTTKGLIAKNAFGTAEQVLRSILVAEPTNLAVNQLAVELYQKAGHPDTVQAYEARVNSIIAAEAPASSEKDLNTIPPPESEGTQATPPKSRRQRLKEWLKEDLF